MQSGLLKNPLSRRTDSGLFLFPFGGLRTAAQLHCPVLAIHGDWDPSPSAAIEWLGTVIPDFRFELLEKCGHSPWREKHARDRFYAILRAEVTGRDPMP